MKNISEKKQFTSDKTVVIGMSGGVDSSVAAYILKDQGFDVVGLFLKGWHPPGVLCNSIYDRQDAMKVCARIGISYHEQDTVDLFNKKVIEPFFETYKQGMTPNPDVLCNSEVKFSVLSKVADILGATHIATGHYARKTKEGILMSAIDNSKDQSYFLWNTSSTLLTRTLFPLGEMKKTEIRAFARKIGLHVAEKKDSTGLCFVGDISVQDMLQERLGIHKGDIQTKDGTTIGTHKGLWYYTQGQRVGSTLSRPYANISCFVVNKKRDTNVLVASNDPTDALMLSTHIKDIHLFSDINLPIYIQTRHLGERVEISSIQQTSEGYALTFVTPVLAPSGQSAVLYTEEGVCVGGGVIQGTEL